MPNTKKIIQAIEKFVLNCSPLKSEKESVLLIHDEACGYVFYTSKNVWKTADFQHINTISQLGWDKDYSLLD